MNLEVGFLLMLLALIGLLWVWPIEVKAPVPYSYRRKRR